jgi:hypothetical protein
MELFCLAKCTCSIFKFTSKKKKLYVTEKIFSEEITKYDDKNELKEEQRNDFLYMVEISVIALNQNHNKGESELLVEIEIWPERFARNDSNGERNAERFVHSDSDVVVHFRVCDSRSGNHILCAH